MSLSYSLFTGDGRSFGRGTLVAGRPTNVRERCVGCSPYKSTSGVFYLTDINMWCSIYCMNKHQEFLKYEAVLAHCEKRAPEGSLFAAMEYGREMQFFDGHNSLSEAGQLLAEMLIPSIEDLWSKFCVLELTAKCGLYRSLLGGTSSETTIRLHRFWRRRFTKWICLKNFGTNYINTFTSLVLLHIELH